MHITSQDLINGLGFELCGAVFKLLDVKELVEHKRVRGMHWASTAFFTSWGVFNCWLYPRLNMPLSTLGAVLLAAANGIWLFLMLRYKRQRSL